MSMISASIRKLERYRLGLLVGSLILTSTISMKTFCQSKPSASVYQSVCDSLKRMLAGKGKLSFKRAVFMTENAFYDSLLSYKDFDATIMNLQHLAEDWLKYNRLPNYGYEDSGEVNKGFAIYKL